MSRNVPRRKAAPVKIVEKEGIPPEDEGEAPPPDNEEELLNGVVDDDVVEGEEVVEEESAPQEPPTKAPKTGKKAPAKKTAPVKGGAKRATKTPAAKGKKAEGDEATNDGKRSFKINVESIDPAIEPENLSKDGGRFGGRTPMQAGKKAATQISRTLANEVHSYDFSIVETTRNGGGKEFFYHVDQYLLDEPEVITKSGNEFSIYYKRDVKARKMNGGATKAKPKAVKGSPKQGRAKTARDEPTEEPTEEILDELVEEQVDEVAEEAQKPAPKTPAKKKAPAKAPPKTAGKTPAPKGRRPAAKKAN